MARNERSLLTHSLTLAVLAVYKRYASETISVVPFLLGRPLVYTSSLEVARQILDSSLFDKAPETSSALSWVFQCCQQNIYRNFFFPLSVTVREEIMLSLSTMKGISDIDGLSGPLLQAGCLCFVPLSCFRVG